MGGIGSYRRAFGPWRGAQGKLQELHIALEEAARAAREMGWVHLYDGTFAVARRGVWEGWGGIPCVCADCMHTAGQHLRRVFQLPLCDVDFQHRCAGGAPW